MKRLLALLILALTCPLARAGTIVNHAVWYDTDGQRIDCHEGGILRVGKMFYWYGRAYAGNPDGIYGAGGAHFHCGIRCYSSTDLVHWKNEDMVLPHPTSGVGSNGTWHRPRVLYNAASHLFVLWFTYLQSRYPADAAVATSKSPTGPFTNITEVGDGFTTGDLTVMQDDKGNAYICHAGGVGGGGWECRIALLAPNYLSVANRRIGICFEQRHARYLTHSLAAV